MSAELKQRLGKIGIIAGGGDLPLKLVDSCRSSGLDFHILGIDGWAGSEIEAFNHDRVGLGQVGRVLSLLQEHGCQSVVIAGYVKRPDFNKLKLDMGGAKILPKVLAAARKGDDALLGVLVQTFEAKGFKVVGADEIFAGLLAVSGVYGSHHPTEVHKADIARAKELIRAISPFDVGQGAIVCEGLVLAVEAAEGTDQMLRHLVELPEAIRGSVNNRRGVLVKTTKKGQEKRVDLPTIGPLTVELAAAAGLAGIAVEAGASLVLDKDEAITKADTLGLFLIGIDTDEDKDAP